MAIGKPAPFFLIPALMAAALGCGQEADTGGGPDPSSLQRRMAPPQAANYLIRGQEAFHDGRIADALALADSAEAAAPDLADVAFLRGLIYSRLGRLEAARQAYRRVVAQDSCYTGAWGNLGNAALRDEEFDDALEAYQRERSCRPAASTTAQIGRTYAHMGRRDSARAAYEAALSMDSTLATAHAYLAQLDDESGALESALERARTALRLDSDNLDYRYYVGSLLLRTGHAEDALPYLRTVVEERPWHYGAHYNLGQALVRLDRTQEGQDILERADSLERLDARIVQLQDRTRLHPEDPEEWTRLASAYMRSGRTADALDAFRSAVALDPANVQLQSNLASMEAMAGRVDDAVERFRRILSKDSTLAEVWLNLGLAYARAGRIPDARDAWRTALRHDADQAQARALLSEYGG